VSIFFLFPLVFSPLLIQHADAALVTLAWNPNSEPDIAGYRVYYGRALGNYQSVIDVGNQHTCSISDLEDGRAYYFVVTAYDLLGRESDFSSELRYPEPFSLTTTLSTGLNLISFPLEPLNPSISFLREKLSPCLLQVFTHSRDAQGYDIWLSYDPSFPDQSTLGTMETGKGYWVDMVCPEEMTVAGNRTTNPVALTPGPNLVGYNSLTPLPAPDGLASITGKVTFVWDYKDGQWSFYDPADESGSTLQALTPGSGYRIEATEKTTWMLPYTVTIPLASGWNLISLPLEPLNPAIAALTQQISPCLHQVLTRVNGVEVHYDPSQLDQNTLGTVEPGRGYWFDMVCPAEMTVIGNRTTNPITLLPGLSLIGYNSLKPIPVSAALSTIAGKYARLWAYKDNGWTLYDPADEAGSTLQVLTPGSGYWIETMEETTWALP
jgi:hypothetical protein